MDNIVRTWEEIELTDEELEVIYGAQLPTTAVTVSGNVFNGVLNASGNLNVTGLNLTNSGGTLVGSVTLDGSLSGTVA